MELKEKRRLFLAKLWESTEGDENEILDMWEIGKELGFSNTEIRKISQYLEGENQIVFRTEQGEISISHEGVKEAEKSKFGKKAPELEEVIVKSSNIDPKKVFVVHGRNEKARRAMFDFLRSLGLDPIEWNRAIKSTGKGAPFIGEVLDKAFEIAQAIIVLITGDDIAKLKGQYVKPDDPDYEKNYTPQARPNVIFEAGLAFGRQSDRTVIAVLEKETTRPFSDIYGRHLVKLSNKAESRKDIMDRLRTAGCEIDIEGKTDWMNTGDFEGVIDRNFINLAQEELLDQRRLEFTDEQLFVLALIVESEEEVSERLLSESFGKEFPDAYVVEFKYIISWLERNELIRITGSIGGHILYVATDKGIEHAKKELIRIKNYKKKIDEFKEKSKIVKGF